LNIPIFSQIVLNEEDISDELRSVFLNLTSIINSFITKDEKCLRSDLDFFIKTKYLPIETSLLRQIFLNNSYSKIRIVSRPEGLFSFRLGRAHVSHEVLLSTLHCDDDHQLFYSLKARLELVTSLYRIITALPDPL